jgi:hypothetical protein
VAGSFCGGGGGGGGGGGAAGGGGVTWSGGDASANSPHRLVPVEALHSKRKFSYKKSNKSPYAMTMAAGSMLALNAESCSSTT